MNIVLFDTEERAKLFPIALTRAIAAIRVGIVTIKERWEMITGAKVFVITEEYLQALYEPVPAGDCLFVDARIIPSQTILKAILSLAINENLHDENGLIAGRAFITQCPTIKQITSLFAKSDIAVSPKRIMSPTDIFAFNSDMISFDFALITKDKISVKNIQSIHITNPSEVFIEEGADIETCSINASAGPVYIGKNATIMDGCLIRGPFALCEGAVLKMGSKIYGATTIGPYSTCGGEIKNSVITGYSNKAHDGYLGDSVIGEWCNMGAGTSNSNVKNTGSQVNIWSYHTENFVQAGNKCGVIMGDYSRTAINSSINTGAVIGVCCNVFGEGLSPNFIPDFSWGTKTGERYQFTKAVNDILNWKKMKNKTISEPETNILKHIFDQKISNI